MIFYICREFNIFKNFILGFLFSDSKISITNLSFDEKQIRNVSEFFGGSKHFQTYFKYLCFFLKNDLKLNLENQLLEFEKEVWVMLKNKSIVDKYRSEALSLFPEEFLSLFKEDIKLFDFEILFYLDKLKMKKNDFLDFIFFEYFSDDKFLSKIKDRSKKSLDLLGSSSKFFSNHPYFLKYYKKIKMNKERDMNFFMPSKKFFVNLKKLRRRRKIILLLIFFIFFLFFILIKINYRDKFSF